MKKFYPSNSDGLISVIMPIYNIAKIKNKCKKAIRSIVEQTYTNWELIIINDGSTDQSVNIIKKIIKNEGRINIFSKENGGVESARRYGIKIAKGSFILHIDQDDYYRYDAFEIFLQKITETGADVAVANKLRFIFTTKYTIGGNVPPSMQRDRVIEHDEFMKSYYISFFGINDFPVNIWNKMYRKSFLDNIPEPPLTGQIIEDLSYNMHVLPYASKICVVPENLYYYRWGGFTNRYDKTILDTALVGYKLKRQLIDKYKLNHFKHTTAIELLNYLNTYFLSLICYEDITFKDFSSIFYELFKRKDVIEATEIVKKENKYHRDYIDAMLDLDSSKLYLIENLYKKRSRKRRLIKKILLKL